MPSGEAQTALGHALRELRLAAGLTQEQAAHRAGITVGTLSVIERGRANPSWGTVAALAQALGVSVAEVAKRAGQ